MAPPPPNGYQGLASIRGLVLACLFVRGRGGAGRGGAGRGGVGWGGVGWRGGGRVGWVGGGSHAQQHQKRH